MSQPLCSLVLRYIPTSRRSDLFALLKTSRSFHAATEPIFYSYLIFTNVHRVQLFAQTLHTNPRLAAHVKTFGINLQELRAHSTNPIDILHLQVLMRPEFWVCIRRALECMTSLQVLVLAQMQGQGIEMDITSVLDAPFTFRLRQVKLHIVFDHHVAQFLRHQTSLCIVQMYAYDSPSPIDTHISPISLPSLTQFDGSLSVARYILSSPSPPLTHLQLLIDTDPDTDPEDMDTTNTTTSSDIPPTTVTSTATSLLLPLLPPTLRGLSLLDIPKHTSTHLFTLLSHTHTLAHSLTHISHLYLPFPAPARSTERVEFLGALIKFRNLRSIEVTLDAWDLPSPSSSSAMTTPLGGPGIGLQGQIPSTPGQKALAAEMKTYCPTLQTVVFWTGKTRFRWAFINNNNNDDNHYGEQNQNQNGSSSSSKRLENAAVDGEWQNRVDTNQWPALSNLWCTS